MESLQKRKSCEFNPTLSGMWNGAGYPGGGHYDPPPEISQNEATEACEGSN